MDSPTTQTEPVEASGGRQPPVLPSQPAVDALQPPATSEPTGGSRPPLAPRPLLRDTVRRLLHTAVLFLSLFLFVRTFAVEPFGVPTGSMAPSLIGNHREAPCPRCGARVVVGDPGQDRSGRWAAEPCCPNCGFTKFSLAEARDVPGDRLLVDKNVYHLRKPRRWEVAVFRCPVDDSKPYVKRIVGLPGEAVRLIGGDVFADGVLQRKTLAQLRETAVPVFDMRHTPAGGWNRRWATTPLDDDPRLPAALHAPADADEAIVRDGVIRLDATAADRPGVGLTYHHRPLDAAEDVPVDDAQTYNGPRRYRPQPVHDFLLAFDLELTGTGSFAVRLMDGLDSVVAEFPVGGGPKLSRGGGDEPRRGSLKLEAGRKYRVEFAFVDRRASLAIDGAEAVPALDLPGEEGVLARRGPVRKPVQLGARGATATVRNLLLCRDVHYRAEGPHASSAAYPLAAGEYFVLGDNSPNSHDSREWAVPGVPERDFLGKPFLIHQPLTVGTVTWNGQPRAYQTVDWARLRWLR